MVAGVPSPGGRVSFPQNLGELERTKQLLQSFTECLQADQRQVAAFRLLGQPSPAFRRCEALVAQRDLSILSKYPLQALAASVGIPVEIMTLVVVRYISVFQTEARFSDGPEENGKSVGWKRPTSEPSSSGAWHQDQATPLARSLDEESRSGLGSFKGSWWPWWGSRTSASSWFLCILPLGVLLGVACLPLLPFRKV